MIIYLDMDETLVNLVDPWLEYLNSKAGTDFSRKNTTAYSVEQSFEDKLSRTAIFKPFKTKGFWVNLPPFVGAIPFVEQLHKDHTVYLATIPALGKVCAYEKEKWMAKHLPFLTRDRLILCHHKYLLRGDILLDDNPKYLSNFTGKRLLFDKPWNRNDQLLKEGFDPERFIRIHSYGEALSYINQLWLPFKEIQEYPEYPQT